MGLASELAAPGPASRPLAPAAAEPAREPLRADPHLARAREAGGPIDMASYSCECGYIFAAPVSTTVHCPHCGVGQAW
jgi:hypothetical protein